MNYKKIFQTILILLLVLFIGLYISQMTGYYQYSESKKTTLTKSAIEKFEEDIKAGKKVDVKNYLVEEKNYNNKISSLGMNLSSLIEKCFNKAMNSLFNEIAKAINK